MHLSKQSEREVRAEWLEINNALTLEQESRLEQMGATVRNASSYFDRVKLNEETEALTRKLMEKMSVKQLSDLMSLYHMMGQICSEVLERKLHGMVNLSLSGCLFGFLGPCKLRNKFVYL